ncbi:hypothetical protein BO82DRAFT_20714 [Aspergillus uvarum CBS 121591]|uniref:Uncharacterized protein n=1 Tax=Aspergillus uvarum CBS 121591 TaxID=1448315 RepID=A0A319BQ61_9EURO|nr:hypothetical protein BO82DRAFT_20714 [Aspergillus uvarum CBS 121591]PYH75576.1 hypothetical protein BO82DRAFT_20714 [Aspergillus uvarum CBS 121591]
MPFFRKQKRGGPPPPPSQPDPQASKPPKTGSHSIHALFTGKKPRPAAHPPNGSETSTTTPKPQGAFSISFHPKPQPTLCWQNIDPPDNLLVSLDEKALEQQFLLHRPRARATAMIDTSRTTSPTYTSPKAAAAAAAAAATLLPGYNDVSGSVIVDWNGYPHFLSPQEEVDRKLQLEAAVQERMLGLPRRTDFAWERPATLTHHQQQGCGHYAPPRYTPAGAKSGSRSSCQSTSSSGSGSSGRR